MTRPHPPAEYVPAWALRPGMVIQEDSAHPCHRLATTEPCREGFHLHFTDGAEVVTGVRHVWTVTEGIE